jgi:phosphatidylglycerophosphate synthase
MSDHSRAKTALLRVIPLLGVGLLAYLLSTVKLSALAVNAKAIGWGMLLVIALAGCSHLIKTWAWRLTLAAEARKTSFARMLGLRLISEAIGQFGFIGMLGGEAARASLLGSEVSVAGAISSVALDRTLFILAGAVVTIAGVVGLLLAVSVSHAVHYYAAALVLGLLLLLVAGAIAIQRRWPVFSGPARAAARIPRFRTWVLGKQATLEAAESRIVEFYHKSPRAFWCSVVLNLFCHFLAIMEVYLIIRMLGAPATLLGALILESLTKLINVAGSVNPGNVGTYEGGNMVIGRLVRMTAMQGLLLALCRRLRAVFWAIVGGICLFWFTKKRGSGSPVRMPEVHVNTTPAPADDSRPSVCECKVAFILAHDSSQYVQFEPVLARVATLPILLRAILNVQSEDTVRTIVVLNPNSGPEIRRQLLASGRLPAGTEWLEVAPDATLPEILRVADVKAGRVEFVRGNCSYRPNLFRMLHEWNGEAGAIELVSTGEPIGLMALGREMAEKLAAEHEKKFVNEMDLHHWIAEHAEVAVPSSHPYMEVEEDSWQAITRPEDLQAAERKLDRWLVKPTDGIFARMNRRVSIPISRRLIKFPITPNMVSLFTLVLSIAAAGFFALGGYWNSLVGAVLGVWGSILDGCDGEVARLKLQASDFGCWLDTICDYAYYIVTFAGIIVGVARSTGDPKIIGWGLAIFAGALLTFISAAIGRKRMSGKRPEQYLQVWQKNAESRSSGLLLRMGRQTEFIVRRCFLPYLLLVFAVLNLMHALVYMAAFGANVAWIVSLRSLIAFSGRSKIAGEGLGPSGPGRKPLIAKA